jgi:hypothetical protein
MAYLIYIHAENDYKCMRDLPTSTGRATDSTLRRRSHTYRKMTCSALVALGLSAPHFA